MSSLDLSDKARLLSPTLSSIGWRRGRKPELDAALGTAEYYGLTRADTRRIVKQAVAAVSSWRAEAAKLGCSRRETERMASAFEHDARDDAGAYAK